MIYPAIMLSASVHTNAYQLPGMTARPATATGVLVWLRLASTNSCIRCLLRLVGSWKGEIGTRGPLASLVEPEVELVTALGLVALLGSRYCVQAGEIYRDNSESLNSHYDTEFNNCTSNESR